MTVRVATALKIDIDKRLAEEQISIQELLHSFLTQWAAGSETSSTRKATVLAGNSSGNLIDSLQHISSESAAIAKAASDLALQIESVKADADAFAVIMLSAARIANDKAREEIAGGGGGNSGTPGGGAPTAPGNSKGKPKRPS